MNAVRRGLLARYVVLDNESRDCFDQVVMQYLDCFRPANDVELGMIEEMIAAFWRQRRAWAIETSLMDTAISKEPSGDELIRIAAAYTSLSQQPQSALISRYEARLHRMFQRALDNLLLLRTIALPNEPDARIELPDDLGVQSIELPNEPDIRLEPSALPLELRNEPGALPLGLRNDSGDLSLIFSQYPIHSLTADVAGTVIRERPSVPRKQTQPPRTLIARRMGYVRLQH